MMLVYFLGSFLFQISTYNIFVFLIFFKFPCEKQLCARFLLKMRNFVGDYFK
jgi:hypothetical protein